MEELGKEVLPNQTCKRVQKGKNILVVTRSRYGNMQMKEQVAHATKLVAFLFPSFNNFLVAI